MDVIIPPVGESISEVIIGRWLKENGAEVTVDELICELESEKANFEIRAEAAGRLEHKAQEGDTVAVGAAIATISEGATAATSSKTTSKEVAAPMSSSSTKEATAQEVRIPTVGESISEVILGRWLKKEGATVAVDEPIAELESEKANFELTAPVVGQLQQAVKEGDTLPIGAVACRIVSTAATVATAEKLASATVVSSSASQYAAGHPSPAAAKQLREQGVDVSSVQGTGPGGRITQADAQQAIHSRSTTTHEAPKPGISSAQSPTASTLDPSSAVSSSTRQQRKERLSSLRKTIARRLVQVKNETAMLTTFNEVDMASVIALRKRYKDPFKEKYEVGLGFMSFFTKAVCLALQDWPAVNAQFTGDSVLYHDYCDMSIAVSTPRGLVVPVIRSAEKMGFHEVEKEILRLATRAREGKISIEEMSGGTFTITNGGVFGSLLSTPIINAPQSAILGMHNIVQRPVVVEGEITARPMMYLALSYDHRIVDGRESVSFLVRIKELLEDPARLLLGV